MAEVGLQRPCIPPCVCLVEATGMPEHVGMRLDLELGGLTSSADELLEVAYGHRRAALGHEQEWRSAFGLAVQSTQRAQLPACQRLRRRRAVLCPGDRQRRGLEINLGPLQVANFGRPESMPEGNQDHGLVPVRPAIALAAFDQPLDL